MIMYLHNLTLIALVPSGALLYFIIPHMTGGTDNEDISLVKNAAGR
jgi:hypothetical protein